jgi:USP8 interacting.
VKANIFDVSFVQDHNCVKELRSIVHKQQQKMVNMETEMSEQRFQMTELKRQLTVLQELMRAMKVSRFDCKYFNGLLSGVLVLTQHLHGK